MARLSSSSLRCVLLCTAAVTALRGADFPQAEIANGQVRARLYLPDGHRGYYQATRFDWSGQIATLEFRGHTFFGRWFEKYDPKIHDCIMGPVEEFLTDGAGLGYNEAQPGGTFVKIGVGAIRKPQEARFQQFHTYQIADGGKWSIRKGRGFVEFTQTLTDTAGYAYVYRKTVRLMPGAPMMLLQHSLRNTGRKRIESTVYEHDFFMLDNQPAGPEYTVRFPWPVHALADLHGMAETRGRELLYLRELQTGQSIFSPLEGFGGSAADYQIRVENRKAGIGVIQTADRPIARMNFWSIRTTVCPEAYIDIRIEPGEEFRWNISYEFYALPSVPR